MLRAWAPGVPGITEVLHARFTDRAYPEHAHDTWTLLVVDRIRTHLRAAPPDGGRPDLAHDLRDPLDAHLRDGLALRDAGRLLHAHPAHLVRRFTTTYGLSPHRYLTGRRVERARRLLLAGTPIAEVAGLVGFHDQTHLHRHVTRLVGTTPGRFAAAR